MSRLRPQRPSPALVISILALVVALSGTAIAATKIGTKNLKKNAVTAAKIKKNAVTSAKIKNKAITGAKLNLAKLGTVPSATDATNSVNATNFSRFYTSGLKKASEGDTNVQLGSIGPFTFVGKCEKGTSEPTKTYAQIYMKVGAGGAFAYNYETAGYSSGELNAGDEPQIAYQVFEETPEWGGYGPYSGFTAASADGSTMIEGGANAGVRVFGADCAFNLWWLNVA